MPKIKIRNPWGPLTRKPNLGTVEGGTEGSEQGSTEPPRVSSADLTSDLASEFSIALDALVDMFEGYIRKDRALLDTGFENLVTVIEEWRDAVPKA